MQQSNSQLLYIVSDVRSGSTLLDFLLARHSKVASVGEMHWLHQYYTNEYQDDIITKGICTCGELVSECSFWSKIELGLNEKNMTLSEMKTYISSPKGVIAKLWMNLILCFSKNRVTSSYNFSENSKVVKNSELILREIQNFTGANVLIESSKETERAKLYQHFLKIPVRYVFLVRDSRGVISSKMKRGIPFFKSTFSWLFHNLKILIVERSIPRNQRIFIRYEDVCIDPEGELKKIFNFLDLNFEKGILDEIKYDSHNIGGSPYRFKKESVKIKLDRSWVDTFSFFQHIFILLVTGLLNKFFGYSLSFRN